MHCVLCGPGDSPENNNYIDKNVDMQKLLRIGKKNLRINSLSIRDNTTRESWAVVSTPTHKHNPIKIIKNVWKKLVLKLTHQNKPHDNENKKSFTLKN